MTLNKKVVFQMKKICALIIFLMIMLCCSFAFAENTALTEPLVEKNDTLSTGVITTWATITFGSYPQTEILSEPSSAVDLYAVDEGEFLIDPALYEKLAASEWNSNETEIVGVRYLRINQERSVHSASNSTGHYRWQSKDQWHFFRYDPIRWRVLRLENGKALLMSDRLLDCQPYNTEDGPVTWENSTVRSFLNSLPETENAAGINYREEGFLNRAFSEDQKKAILMTRVENKPNSRYGTYCGSDTDDRIFLLSSREVFGTDTAAQNGFYSQTGKDDPAKRFRSTMYAKCRGAWWSSVDGYKGNSFWFMRTNGYNRESVSYICDFGYTYQRGTITTCDDAGLLPALWIDLNLANYEAAGSVTSGDIQNDVFSKNTDKNREKEQIVNPLVEADPDLSDGKTVTYSLVRFGSYPQSEIVPDTALITSDSIVDSELYEVLAQADWKESELEYEHNRFLRVSSDREGDTESFRYFLYEPLLWRVLEVHDGTALLLSHSAIDCEPFQENLSEVSWDNCTLRSYLNGYNAEKDTSAIDYSDEKDNFLDIAFSPNEQSAILENPVRNEANYYFGTESGNQTVDKIFLLAESELFIFDSSEIHGFSPQDAVPDRAKQFTPTDYAVWKGAWSASESNNYGNVFWLTRTTGYTPENVVYVDESGYMYNRGILVTCSDAAVIPALVLDLDLSVYEYAGTYTIN